MPHKHHHGGHRRRGMRGGRGYAVDVVDFVPEVVTSECILERQLDGSLLRRCPPRATDAMGFQPIGYLKFSDAMGFQGPTESTRPLTEYLGEQNQGAGDVGGTSTSTDVRSPTRTEVRSPTRTSTKAYTQGNFTATVTGGAGAGPTSVTIHSQPLPHESAGAGEFSGRPHAYGPRTQKFLADRFAGMTFYHGQDYMTNANAYRKRLPDGSWKWCYPGDEARSLADTTRPKEAGDIFPTFVSADSAKAYIAETDTGYDTLDASISAAAVPPEFSAAWKATYMGWKGFAAAARASVGIFTAKSVMEQTDRWVETLGKFSIQFHQIAPSSPVPTMPSQPGQGVPDKGAASLLSGTTGLVLAGAVLAGILVFGKVAK